MTKVYWGRNGGVVVRRDKRGKFARRGTKTLLALIVVGFLVFGIIAPRVNVTLDHEMVATGTTLIAQPAFAGENFEAKITKAQNIVVDEIASCETPGIKEPDATIVLHSNNEMSIGSWQWQTKSIQHYVKERDDKDSSAALRRRFTDRGRLGGPASSSRSWDFCAREWSPFPISAPCG